VHGERVDDPLDGEQHVGHLARPAPPEAGPGVQPRLDIRPREISSSGWIGFVAFSQTCFLASLVVTCFD